MNQDMTVNMQSMPSPQQAQQQQQQAMNARRQQQQAMANNRTQEKTGSNGINPSLLGTMRPQGKLSKYDDIPSDPDDDGFNGPEPGPEYFVSFESACRHGPLSTVQSIVSSSETQTRRSPAFIHYGLTLALKCGNIEVARYLLSIAGAPIVRETPKNILFAPRDRQIPLFDLLSAHGWTPNTPGYYGEVLLSNFQVVTNLPLLRWFLDHGADPNFGRQPYFTDRFGGSEIDSCDALESAARYGDAKAVRMLLDAGAKIRNGVPLHRAAGACPPGANPFSGPVTPSKEFDAGMIPVMALLVERGADVNQRDPSLQMVARYAVVEAVMAGAVERVRWLLGHGADPEAKGAWGSAVEYARMMGSEEMIRVVDEGVNARKWVNNNVK